MKKLLIGLIAIGMASWYVPVSQAYIMIFYPPSTVVTTPAFSPSDLAGLDLWLKADSLALNDGDLVSTWADQSGVGNDATQSGGARPTYKTNIQNGKPVVRFASGPGNCMTLNSAFYDDSYTAFAVIQRSLTTTNILPLGGTNSSGVPYFIYPFTDGNVYSDNKVGYTVFNDNTATMAIWSVYASSGSGQFPQVYKNGASQPFNPTVFAQSATYSLVGCRNPGTAEYSNGDIAEIIMYNVVLSDTDRQKVETYLNTKYAIF